MRNCVTVSLVWLCLWMYCTKWECSYHLAIKKRICSKLITAWYYCSRLLSRLGQINAKALPIKAATEAPWQEQPRPISTDFYGRDLVETWSRILRDLVEKWSRSGRILAEIWSRFGSGLVEVRSRLARNVDKCRGSSIIYSGGIHRKK